MAEKNRRKTNARTPWTCPVGASSTRGNTLDNELKQHLDAMEARLTVAKKSHVSEQCERLETSLLTAFHGWARPHEIRARSVSTAVLPSSRMWPVSTNASR